MLKTVIISLSLLAAVPACAQTAGTANPEDWGLTEVAVTKDLPGPALWRVTKGDKIVWIIGTTTIQGKAAWDSARIDRILSDAETLYLPPAAVGGISVVYSVMKDKDLPGKTRLKDVVSAAEYARFVETARRHGIKTADIEKDKPLWAGLRLSMAVSKKYDYSSSSVINQLTKTAKKHKVKVRRVATYEIKPLLSQVNGIDAAEARRCLTASLDTIDYQTKNVPIATSAWVGGDVARLKPILNQYPKGDCLDALGDDLTARSVADTVGTIEKAMTGARRSVLILPMHALTGDDRLIGELRRRGFTVREPR
ncbi:TraB/GumN family protein [Asticcacaulis sp. BYS171W]|uniref:TraB/GumN family protein n=1 Tax=Asticcacaulis aquaticus TaxID=2984212 RepID=A0ABT5HUZ6_9CAUL|nr:TraB/GumN family protein [Asticcacaulis aquaticus]MDC7683799.1 TraB/GumN family protein [Asticcacaulis aquaticus]